MYEDFIKGTMDADERDKAPPETDPKRAAFYDVSIFSFSDLLSSNKICTFVQWS